METEQNNQQPNKEIVVEEKDSFFKRIKRGFKVLLDKAKTAAEYINTNNNSKESNDFFKTDFGNVNQSKPVETSVNQSKPEVYNKKKEEKKQEKNPFDIDLNNIAKCDL